MQSDKPKIFFLTGRLFRQEDRLFLTGRHEDMMLGCEKNKKNVFLSSCQRNMSSCPICKYHTSGKKVLQNKN